MIWHVFKLCWSQSNYLFLHGRSSQRGFTKETPVPDGRRKESQVFRVLQPISLPYRYDMFQVTFWNYIVSKVIVIFQECDTLLMQERCECRPYFFKGNVIFSMSFTTSRNWKCGKKKDYATANISLKITLKISAGNLKVVKSTGNQSDNHNISRGR